MDNKIYQAYFSKKAAEIYGTVWYYLQNSNEKVETTGVYSTVEEAQEWYEWDDKVWVGECDRFHSFGAPPKWENTFSGY